MKFNALDKEDIEIWNDAKKLFKPLNKRYKNTSFNVISPPIFDNSSKIKQIKYCEKQLSAERNLFNLEKVFSIEVMDPGFLKKIKQGSITIDKYIDLHGLYSKEAAFIVENFIKDSYYLGYKLILIITGKGTNKKSFSENIHHEVKSILQNVFLQIVNNDNMSKFIISYCYAFNKHGGEGAYYVRLRKNRNI